MTLTDQQLRQELLKYGETVPPITQRNREQLRAHLEIVRLRTRSPVKPAASPRARSPTSPSTRASGRSRPSRRLIELSDSDTDAPSNEYLATRKGAPVHTRSVAVGRDTDRVTPISSANVTADVEQSIARHRREIQQLIDSARDRSRVSNTNASPSKYELPSTTPLRPNAASSYQRQRSKPDNTEKPKQPSWFTRNKEAIQSFWKRNREDIIKILQCLIGGLLLGAGFIFLFTKGGDLIPHRRGITCSPQNATECDEMIPLINTLKTHLQNRKGEVDCGTRPSPDSYLTKSEINKYLDDKGFKFELGPEERWNTALAYIFDKPDDDILVLNKDKQLVNTHANAYQLIAKEGTHSLVCRAQKGVNSAMQHLAWVLLGTTGFLTLGWLLKRRLRQQEESEKTYKDFIQKITDMLENQYEEHLNDPETKPYLAISHIRDMLIAPQDRKRLKVLWERAKKQISESESRVRSESQLIHGEEFDVWRWIQPRSPSSPSPQRKKRAESPQSSNEESYVYMPSDVGLTTCLKLRNFFDPDTMADDDEIDLVVDSIQNRCATVRRIEHIGIHAIYVYLKFSSKEAAAQGFHLLNNWKYNGREVIAKYLRLERYHEHFPEARDSGSTNN